MLAFGHSGRGRGLHGAFSQAPRAGLAWPLTTTVSNPTWMPARLFRCALGAAEVTDVQWFTNRVSDGCIKIWYSRPSHRTLSEPFPRLF